jgi:hypothetical protein
VRPDDVKPEAMQPEDMKAQASPRRAPSRAVPSTPEAPIDRTSEEVSAWLDGELADDERRALELRFETEPDLRQRADAFSRVDAAIASWARIVPLEGSSLQDGSFVRDGAYDPSLAQSVRLRARRERRVVWARIAAAGLLAVGLAAAGWTLLSGSAGWLGAPEFAAPGAAPAGVGAAPEDGATVRAGDGLADGADGRAPTDDAWIAENLDVLEDLETVGGELDFELVELLIESTSIVRGGENSPLEEELFEVLLEQELDEGPG